MPRLSKETWSEIRAEREVSGLSYAALGAKYGVSDVAVLKRARAEDWNDSEDVIAVVRRLANEKISGTVSCDPEKKAAAIDAEADRVVKVIETLRSATQPIRERRDAAAEKHGQAKTREDKILAFEDLKAAKIMAETEEILQRMERKNWSLDRQQEQDSRGVMVINHVRPR